MKLRDNEKFNNSLLNVTARRWVIEKFDIHGKMLSKLKTFAIEFMELISVAIYTQRGTYFSWS